MKTRLPLLTALFALATTPAFAQHPPMPPDMSHEEHLAQMQKDAELKRRGAEAMGFDQNVVVHHFVLTPSGGSIEVGARDAADTKTIAAIRTHLHGIAADFGRGNFQGPFTTHAEMPPGVPTLKRLKSSVLYRFAQTTAGGRVAIFTTDAEALQAVHQFLVYQIREHHTGDSEAIK